MFEDPECSEALAVRALIKTFLASIMIFSFIKSSNLISRLLEVGMYLVPVLCSCALCVMFLIVSPIAERASENRRLLILAFIGNVVCFQTLFDCTLWLLNRTLVMVSHTEPASGLPSLNHLQANNPCPWAWSDPMTSYVWALA